MKTHLIGIDPSFKNVGIAVYRPENGAMSLHSGDLFSAIDFLNRSKLLGKCIVVLEDPNLNPNLFGGWPFVRAEIMKTLEKRPGYIPFPTGLANVQSAYLRSAKQAQNVGENKAAAKLFAELFERQGVPFFRVSPTDRHRADKELVRANSRGIKMLVMPTKTNAMQFYELTGYSGRSNEHTRDAATLVHGRTIKWAEISLLKHAEQ